MKHCSKILGIIVANLCLLVINVYGQSAESVQLFSQYVKPESNNQVLIMKDDAAISRQQMLDVLTPPSGPSLKTSSYLSFDIKEEITDEEGVTHSEYALKVNNVEVENEIAKFHEVDGKVVLASLPNLDVPNIGGSVISDIIATANAVSEVTKFEVSNDDKATLLPAQLLVSKLNTGYVLVWKVEAFGEDMLDRYFVYVDAISGNILEKKSRKISCNGTASVPTLYNGNQTINYSFVPGNTSSYELLDNCRPTSCGGSSTTNIETLYWNGSAHVKYSIPVGNAWPTSDINYKIGYSAHWALGKSFDYFKCIHNRNSYDNAAHSITGITRKIVNNAYWNGSVLVFGDANGGTFKSPLVSLDVVGHELTHAVTEYTGGLKYMGESGALNEAWSDIFGTAIEFYVKGSAGNFLIGDEVTTSGALRSMSNPNSRSQPDTYGGSYWVNTTGNCSSNDNCGVHTNSGVANYWFYLLVKGGSGTNDISRAYSVTGIGMDDAMKIAYRSMANYFTPSTNYAAARLYTIRAAEDLFGICSNQAVQVAKAWYAVGVGNDVPNSLIVCGNFTGNNTYRARYTISSGGTYCGGSQVIIPSGKAVNFIAGDNIFLGPNFLAEAGSSFNASITLCNAGQGISTFKQASSSIGAGAEDVNSVDNVGLNDMSNAFISIYPNPSSGVITLSSSAKGKVSIRNSMGESIMEQLVDNGEKIYLDFSDKAKGLYFATIVSGSEIKTQKIVIE